MPGSRLHVLIIVGVVLAGLIGGGLLIAYRITQRIYVFSATIPESTTMNLRANESFDDVGTRSLLSFTACVANGLPPSDSLLAPYTDGQLVTVHLMPSTKIWDRRGQDEPVRADASTLQPGQQIEVRIVDYPVFAGNAEAADITISSDGTPGSCIPYIVNHGIKEP
jgi:hypothetical protein